MLNAEDTIGDQLQALANQSCDVSWEVIVADNGSTDGSRGVVARFAERLPGLHIVDASGARGASHARNAGAAAASGAFLVFVDADDVVAPGWLQAMMDAAARGADFIGGTIDYVALRAGPRQAQLDVLAELPVLLDFLPWTLSGNCGVRRRVFEAVGGWDTSFERGEDVAFSWSAQLAGYQLEFVPEAILFCRLRGDLRSMWRQEVGNGELVPHLLKVYGEYGAKRAPLPRAAKRLLKLFAGAPVLLLTATGRRRWLRRLALEFGRVRGSIRWRVFCP